MSEAIRELSNQVYWYDPPVVFQDQIGGKGPWGLDREDLGVLASFIAIHVDADGSMNARPSVIVEDEFSHFEFIKVASYRGVMVCMDHFVP